MQTTYTLIALLVVVPPALGGVNELTVQKKADGWVLLFDGKTLDG